MKKIHIFIVIGIIIVVSGLAIFSYEISRLIPEKEVGIFQENIKKEIVLVIDDGREFPKTFETELNEKATVFDLLKEGIEKLDLTLRTKTYNIGIMVEAIGNTENGQDGKYWLFYVNGELASVSVDKKEIKAGDKIEFKFEKSPF